MADASKLVSRQEDYNEWYNTLVRRADLADYGPVRGTMIVKPYGWALWENIQQTLDRRFKAVGVENAAFPMLIPQSYLEKEAQHVEGFAPELAVVTHGGGEELAEPLVLRPTSETIVGHTYASWIQSYRDLPLLLNMWNSVVRWEMRTKLFLRTLEFYWQEGHTAHASATEALAFTKQMLQIYADFAYEDAAVPVVTGEKSALERFAGAARTFTLEAMMGDGKALQAATSHYMAQNFARAFDITYLDASNQLKHCWTTSWGLSTRLIGAIIMTHGDDNGLIMPPRLAPYQVVVVPIWRTESQKASVWGAAERLQQALTDAGLRVKMDKRENLSPGYKFNEWELRGVPVRVEVGPRDVENDIAVLARRDRPGREGKEQVAQAQVAARAQTWLVEIQQQLLEKATRFREQSTRQATDYDEFREAVGQGFVRVAWAGTSADETRIKEETQATLRCLLDESSGKGGNGNSGTTCFYTGQPATQTAIFGRSY